MNRTLRRALAFLSLFAAASAGYILFHLQNAPPAPRRAVPAQTASLTESHQPTATFSNAATPPTAPPATKSVLQLHAAFRESQRCMEERVIIRAKSYNPDNASPTQHIPGCDDMKGALRQLHDATIAAAKAGDLDAQICYLVQNLGDRESGFRLTDVEIAEYQMLGAQFVDAAFKRGDWRIVDLLGYHIIDSAGLFMNLEPWKDPSREYKSNQLLLRGAGDVVSQSTDWLRALRIAESKDNWNLSTQEMQDGDAWAQETYDKYFVSRPKLLKEPIACTAEDET